MEGTTPVEAVQVGFWLSPTGLLRLEGVPTRNAEVAYHLFVRLSRPLKPAETVLLTLPDGTRVSHRHEPGERPSALFKLNQVGYALQARRRYAYLGAWLGTAGPLPLRHLDGRPFELRRASDASVAFTGTLRARMEDPKSDQGTPFTGEETLELDFSAWNTPGDYFLWVDGIGRSETFALTPDALAEAFERPHHPAKQQSHDRKKASDREHDEKALQIAELPEIVAAVVLDLIREGRELLHEGVHAGHRHRAAH